MGGTCGDVCLLSCRGSSYLEGLALHNYGSIIYPRIIQNLSRLLILCHHTTVEVHNISMPEIFVVMDRRMPATVVSHSIAVEEVFLGNLILFGEAAAP